MRKSQKILLVFLTIIMIISNTLIMSSATTYSGTCGDNVTWTYDDTTCTLTISGTGDMYDYNYNNRPWGSHMFDIQKVVISNGVTSIGMSSFYNCFSLTNVAVPDSITSINKNSFYSCTNLKSIIIPSNVTFIGDSAFRGCNTLFDVYYGGTETQWKNISTNNGKKSLFCATIHCTDNNIYPSGTCGGNVTWSFNTSTKALTISGTGNMSNFYDYYEQPWSVFQDNINKIIIDDKVTKTGDYAFYGCNNITMVIFPESILSIGNSAFNYCNNLKDVYFTGTEKQWKSITIGSSNQPLLDATIHYNYHMHKYNAVVTAPTCTEQGYTTYSCECGDSYIDGYIDVIDHEYKTVTTPPTCTGQGYTTYTCECGDSYIDNYVDALGHTEEIIPAVAPTCTEPGLTEGAKCSVCGEILTEQKELTANGHTPANAIEENYVLPTCTENGSKDAVVYCSVCKEEISRKTETLEATGHTDVHNDGICDSCDLQLCNHRCHKLGITGFFWRIINLFNQLFGLNKTCDCGVGHY